MFLNIASATTLCLILAYTGWEPTDYPIQDVSVDSSSVHLEPDNLTWSDEILTRFLIFPDDTDWGRNNIQPDKYPYYGLADISTDDNQTKLTYLNISQNEASPFVQDNVTLTSNPDVTLVWKLQNSDQIPTTTDGINEAKSLGYYIDTDGDTRPDDENCDIEQSFPTNQIGDGDSMTYNGTHVIDSSHRKRYTTRWESDSTTVKFGTGWGIYNIDGYHGDESWAFTLIKIYIAAVILKHKITRIFGRKIEVETKKKKRRYRQRRKRKQKTTGLSKIMAYLNVSSLF